MLYPLMTLNDGTEIVFTAPNSDDDTIDVLYERWSTERDAFDDMTIRLPSCQIIRATGFSEEEIAIAKEHMKDMFPLLREFATQGGIGKRIKLIKQRKRQIVKATGIRDFSLTKSKPTVEKPPRKVSVRKQFNILCRDYGLSPRDTLESIMSILIEREENPARFIKTLSGIK